MFEQPFLRKVFLNLPFEDLKGDLDSFLQNIENPENPSKKEVIEVLTSYQGHQEAVDYFVSKIPPEAWSPEDFEVIIERLFDNTTTSALRTIKEYYENKCNYERAIISLVQKHLQTSYPLKDIFEPYRRPKSDLLYLLLKTEARIALAWVLENCPFVKIRVSQGQDIKNIRSLETYHLLKRYGFDPSKLNLQDKDLLDTLSDLNYNENVILQILTDYPQLQLNHNSHVLFQKDKYPISLLGKAVAKDYLKIFKQLKKDPLRQAEFEEDGIGSFFLAKSIEMHRLLIKEKFSWIDEQRIVLYAEGLAYGDFKPDIEKLIAFNKLLNEHPGINLKNYKIDRNRFKEFLSPPSTLQDLQYSLIELLTKTLQNSCTNVFDVLFQLFKGYINKSDLMILIYEAETYNQNQILKILLNYFKPQYSEVQRLIIERLQGLYTELLATLTQYWSPEVLRDAEAMSLIKKTKDPEIACLFIKQGVSFFQKDILSLMLTSYLLQDFNSYQYLCNLSDKFSKFKLPNQTSSLDNSLKIDTSNTLYGTRISQQDYHQFGEKIAAITATEMLNGNFSLSFSTFKYSLKDLGYLRQWIAIKSGTDQPFLFGTPRDGELYTFCNQRYNQYFKRFMEETLSKENYPEDLKNCQYIFDSSTGALGFKAQITTKIHHEEITLMAYSVSELWQWEHTDFNNRDLLLSFCNSLLQNALQKNHIIKNDFIKESSLIHNRLAQATPLQRGSAAVAEWIGKALLLCHGIKANWDGLADCEAFITLDLNQFAENYLNKFGHYQDLDVPLLATLKNAINNIGFFSNFFSSKLNITSSAFKQPQKTNPDLVLIKKYIDQQINKTSYSSSSIPIEISVFNFCKALEQTNSLTEINALLDKTMKQEQEKVTANLDNPFEIKLKKISNILEPKNLANFLQYLHKSSQNLPSNYAIARSGKNF